jgi:biopolymer transport protein ExbB
MVSLQAKQVDYFTEVGSELELIYRQVWWERRETQDSIQLSLNL